MCGRFAITLPHDAVIEWFAARPAPGLDNAVKALDGPRHNVRPTQTVWTVVRGAEGRELRAMRWGFLPRWFKSFNDGPLLINARGETLAEKPAFRDACRETRCLVPADGFYEWKASAGRGKAPYWLYPRGGDRVAFAGVWRSWEGPDGERLETVAIVTCAAPAPLSEIHHRLPVAVAPEDFGLWLGEEGHGAARLLEPPASEFWASHPVSTAINKGGADAPDGPELRAPWTPEAEPAAPPAQGDLF